MPLSAHITPRIAVPLLHGNTVLVRGLNLDDFTLILGTNMEAASKIAALYADQKQAAFSTSSFTAFIQTVASTFPGVVSEVISTAADEPDARNVKLGMSLQIGVLTAIVKLTVEEAGGLGNLFAQFRGAVDAVAGVKGKIDLEARRSNNSTGGGGKTSAS